MRPILNIKVLFKFGKKIFEKITQAMNPQFEDDKAIDPFDLWSGANFKLKIRKVDGYQNYDLSEFDSPSPLSDDDDEMESIWKKEYSLKEILDQKNFKTYDELKKKLDRVLGLNGSTPKNNGNTVEAVKQQRIQEKDVQMDDLVSKSSTTEEFDEDLDFFAEILNDDE